MSTARTSTSGSWEAHLCDERWTSRFLSGREMSRTRCLGGVWRRYTRQRVGSSLEAPMWRRDTETWNRGRRRGRKGCGKATVGWGGSGRVRESIRVGTTINLERTGAEGERGGETNFRYRERCYEVQHNYPASFVQCVMYTVYVKTTTWTLIQAHGIA